MNKSISRYTSYISVSFSPPRSRVKRPLSTQEQHRRFYPLYTLKQVRFVLRQGKKALLYGMNYEKITLPQVPYLT